MKQTSGKELCFACGGTLESGTTTFTADFGSGVVVIRDVPAIVCSQCGMEWIDDAVSEKIEGIVKDAKDKHSVVEVLSMAG